MKRHTSRFLAHATVLAAFVLVLASAMDLRSLAFLWRPAALTEIAQAPPLPLLAISDAAWFFIGSVVTGALLNYRTGRMADRMACAYERRHGYYRLGENDPFYDAKTPEKSV